VKGKTLVACFKQKPKRRNERGREGGRVRKRREEINTFFLELLCFPLATKEWT
jgi:hypothetical protein